MMRARRYYGELVFVAILSFCLWVFGNETAGAGGVSSHGQSPDALKRFVFTVNAFSKVFPDSSGGTVDDKARWRKNVGTAFPVGERGYLITLNCVVRNAEKIKVVGADGMPYEASVVGFDQGARLTVLKLNSLSLIPVPGIKPVSSIKTGSSVMFLGNAPGGALELIPGSVCSIRAHDGLMVVDVSGNPGTCGTPVFDGDGQAVGLLAYRLEEDAASPGHPPGVDSYIVLPLEYASLQAKSVINRFESRSGWLGISLSMGGMIVRTVIPGSPAEKGGIKSGDKVMEFNGAIISTPGDLVRATGATRAGDTVKMKMQRNGEVINITVKLAVFPSSLGK